MKCFSPMKGSLVVLIIICIIVSLGSNQLNAQEQQILFDHIEVKEGLLSDRVYDFYQDSKEFIWLAAHNLIDEAGKY